MIIQAFVIIKFSKVVADLTVETVLGLWHNPPLPASQV